MRTIILLLLSLAAGCGDMNLEATGNGGVWDVEKKEGAWINHTNVWTSQATFRWCNQYYCGTPFDGQGWVNFRPGMYRRDPRNAGVVFCEMGTVQQPPTVPPTAELQSWLGTSPVVYMKSHWQNPRTGANSHCTINGVHQNVMNGHVEIWPLQGPGAIEVWKFPAPPDPYVYYGPKAPNSRISLSQ